MQRGVQSVRECARGPAATSPCLTATTPHPLPYNPHLNPLESPKHSTFAGLAYVTLLYAPLLFPAAFCVPLLAAFASSLPTHYHPPPLSLTLLLSPIPAHFDFGLAPA